MSLNTSNKCSGCGGTVKNIDGKRHSKEKLEAIHAESCAGRRRGKA